MKRSSTFSLAPDWGMVPLRLGLGLVYLKLEGGLFVDVTRAAKSRSAGILALLLMLPARRTVPRC